MAADRQAMALDQDQRNPRPNAGFPRDTVTAHPAPGMLDPLIRALDRAVARTAQARVGRSDTGLRD
jgi:hypothetical protein